MQLAYSHCAPQDVVRSLDSRLVDTGHVPSIELQPLLRLCSCALRGGTRLHTEGRRRGEQSSCLRPPGDHPPGALSTWRVIDVIRFCDEVQWRSNLAAKNSKILCGVLFVLGNLPQVELQKTFSSKRQIHCIGSQEGILDPTLSAPTTK